jgi:hypothetical protein
MKKFEDHNFSAEKLFHPRRLRGCGAFTLLHHARLRLYALRTRQNIVSALAGAGGMQTAGLPQELVALA